MLTSWGQTPFGRGQTPFRRGQALMELAVGMFALAIVVGALCAFAVFMAKSLEVQNSLRSSSPKMSGAEVDFNIVLFHGDGDEHVLKVNEHVQMPSTTIVK